VLALYATLTRHGRDAEMVLALRRIATAPQDAWGRLLVLGELDGSITVGGRVISASVWERLDAAQILQPAMPDSGLFLFSQRSLMHHVLLLAANETALPPSVGSELESSLRVGPQDVDEMQGADPQAPETQSSDIRIPTPRERLASISRR
jgi:hypothetical protein